MGSAAFVIVDHPRRELAGQYHYYKLCKHNIEKVFRYAAASVRLACRDGQNLSP